MYIHHHTQKKKPVAPFTIKPDFIADRVEDIDFKFLRDMGITTCFIDLDGTVVDRGKFKVTPSLKRALKNSGLDIKIATNRPRGRSLKKLKDDLCASGVIHPNGLYGKPTKKYVHSALLEYGLKPEEVVMIGDRFIQDILGANRSGVFSLLVRKLGSSVGIIDEAISSIERRLIDRILPSYRKI